MVTREKLMAALKQLNGCAIASINSKTEVKLTGGKKNPMQGKIEKVMEGGNIMLFCNMNNNSYNDMVKRRLESEGKDPESFCLGKRVWGERVPQTPFVLHNGQVYMEAIFLKSPKKVSYLYNGEPIEKNQIEGLPVKEEGEQGGLENKVIIRTYKLDSVTRLKMGELSVE